MTQLVKIFVILNVWLLSTPGAEAAKKVPGQIAFMKPVRILRAQPASDSQYGSSLSVQASYKLACGESFSGILVRERRSPMTVEVAVVVGRSEAFCSSLPTEVSFALPIRSGVRVRPIKIREPKRVVLEEALDVGVTERAFIVGWQNSCQTMAGVILKPLISHNVPKVEVSLARLPRDNAGKISSVNCVREIKHTKITSVPLPAGSLTVAEQPGKIETSYFTRLVAPQSVGPSLDGSLLVRWQRSCRERNVGLLFIGPEGRDVAVVTAVMPLATCQGMKSVQESYVLPGLMPVKHRPLRPASPNMVLAIGKKFEFNYSIIPATAVNLAREGQGDQLTATAKGLHCSEALGVLAGGDIYGNLALGLLVGTPQSVCAINQSKFIRELTAPIVAPSHGPVPRIFGLRVFGNVLN